MERVREITKEHFQKNPQPLASSVENLMVRGLVMLVRMCAFDVANLDTTKMLPVPMLA
ncbi:hypothetical protein PIB30_024121 [Stylosanthes scabra]|uniref:Uncharacterized protein n=1 Tax=Stylosanthes scabra TaxID=79078 RepID=A0ABU6WAL5_9FABA|nr:hypothetical protein [Stylosanthes scabra]